MVIISCTGSTELILETKRPAIHKTRSISFQALQVEGNTQVSDERDHVHVPQRGYLSSPITFVREGGKIMAHQRTQESVLVTDSSIPLMHHVLSEV